MKSGYLRQIGWLIGLSSLVRLFFASTIELGNDEVYYWTYAAHLQWNYFDHPPMVAVLIRIFTGNMALEGYEVFIRLGSVVCSGLATGLIFTLVSRVVSPKAGFIAALLYTSSLYSSVIAGLMIMPDSAQMLFWMLSLYCLVRIIENETDWTYWLLFGLVAGGTIMSKIHGLFLWTGLILYILTSKRDWLRLWQVYAALALTLVIICPIVVWNVHHQFITYRFHSARVGIGGFHFTKLNFLREIIGQILYTNPVNYILIVFGLITYRRLPKTSCPNPIFAVFNWIALPMIAVTLGLSMFRETLPHWTGPAYATLIPLASWAQAERRYQRPFRPAFAALGILGVFLVLASFLLHTYPGHLPGSAGSPPSRLGEGDISLDLSGWRKASKPLDTLIEGKIKAGILPKRPTLVVTSWFPGAHISYYFARPLHLPIIGLGEAKDLHHFLWLNRWTLAEHPCLEMNYAVAIIPSNYPGHSLKGIHQFYSSVAYLGKIEGHRGLGKGPETATRTFFLYRLSGWKGQVGWIK